MPMPKRIVRISAGLAAAGALCMGGGGYSLYHVTERNEEVNRTVPELKKAESIQAELTSLLKGLDAQSALEKITKDPEFLQKYKGLRTAYDNMTSAAYVQEAKKQQAHYKTTSKIMKNVEIAGLTLIAASMSLLLGYSTMQKSAEMHHSHER